MKQLMTALAQGLTAPVYIFYGDESYLLEQAVAKLTAVVAPDSWNIEVFYGDECAPAAVAEAAREGAMFGGRRLVIVRNTPWLSRKKAAKKGGGEEGSGTEEKAEQQGYDLEPLLEYVAAPNPDAVLLLTVRGNIDNTRKLVKEIKSVGRVVQFAALKDAERESWLRDYLRAAGKSASRQALAYIAVNSGGSLLQLKNEADKLLLYCGEAGEISLDDAEAVSSHSALAGVFKLTDKVAAREGAAAVELLHQLLKQGEAAQMIMALLATQYRNMLALKDMREHGFRSAEAVSRLGVNPYAGEKALTAAAAYSKRQLLRALQILLAADHAAKNGGGHIEQLLETAILRICCR
ncbi:MAG: DNA polymerase III subunit delta [Bacillota bacterium]|nr:DNA polymerase III subunit delta [Bacillota bacterium]